ncbi:MAG TPA: ATP-binding protein [Pseudomonadota bacterium]|nr:ATP-binding protein [Pseudomonadota bacterium]HNF95935.1 ATP-binding protein [Pseudomonadota bacterium]HNN49799.1 ATP-binding protein [Pseudomonadota bacterium]
MQKRAFLRLALFSTAVSVGQLAILLFLTHALSPLGSRALVLSAGLWLLGEALWLRVAQSPVAAARRTAQTQPALLPAFFVRSLLICGWAVVLSLLLLRMQLVSPDLLAVLPWLGLSLGPLLAAVQVLALSRMDRRAVSVTIQSGQSAEPVAWFRQRLLRRSGTVVLAGLATWAQLFALIFLVLKLWLSRHDWLFFRAFAPALAVGEWLWLISSIALLSSIEKPLIGLAPGSPFGRREAVWLRVVHRLLLLPSRLSMAHALLTYAGFAAVVCWLVHGDLLSFRQGEIFLGMVLIGESAAVLWLGLLARRSLRPLFPPASQHLSLRALSALRPPPLSGQVLLLLSTVLLGLALLLLPRHWGSQLVLLLLFALILPGTALLLSILHRKLLGRTFGEVSLGTGDPGQQLGAWLVDAEHSVLGRALLSLSQELHAKLHAASDAQALLHREVEQRTAELRDKNDALSKALAELAQTQDKLVESEKLASIGRLIANVTHEINNPVNAVLNSAAPLSLLLSDLAQRLSDGEAMPLSDRQELVSDSAQMLQVIERGTLRTRDIVRSLHRYSVSDAVMADSVQLADCLREAWTLCQGPGKQQVLVDWQLAELPPLSGHAGQLQQVLTNLLANAVFALHERAQQDPSAPVPKLVLRTEQIGGEQIVAITDNGIGMTSEVRRRLFEPFFSTKDVAHGTGLGLAIAHGIIRAHQGRISVESQPNQGTTFTICLPCERQG